MREAVGDVFEYTGADALCIPICWVLKKNGEAVMGAGVAREAAKRWPTLPRVFGEQIQRAPDAPHVPIYAMGDFWLACVPTKRGWRDPSDLSLIAASVADLVYQAGGFGWQTVVLPRLGCGLGGLSWPDQVRPVLARLLDDRFVVCSLEPAP